MEAFFISALKIVGNPLALVFVVVQFYIIIRLIKNNEDHVKAITANTVVMAEVKTLIGAALQGGRR